MKTAWILLTLAGALSARATPYAIGSRSVTWYDPERAYRPIPADIYYPADSPGNYVPVAAGPFPVVSFGHGWMLPATSYQYLWEALVPQGYIVVFPRTEWKFFSSAHQEYGLDLAYLIRRLEAEGVYPPSAFHGRISGKSCVMGHSMGGGASFLAAASDPTIDAICNLAAYETNPSAVAAANALPIPALMIAGSSDFVSPPLVQALMYEALPSDCKCLITIRNANHCQFAAPNDFCTWLEGDCGGQPTLSRAEQQQIVISTVLPWLRFVLHEQPDALLAFRAAVSSNPQLSSRAEWSGARITPQVTVARTAVGVRVCWCPVLFADAYIVERSTLGLSQQAFEVCWSGTDTSMVDRAVTRTAFYRVRATRAATE